MQSVFRSAKSLVKSVTWKPPPASRTMMASLVGVARCAAVANASPKVTANALFGVVWVGERQELLKRSESCVPNFHLKPYCPLCRWLHWSWLPPW